ncbi:MAG: DUF2490 domain-containing protein [Cyclobacteriaceae bacterium]|jgi:hypothetical protein
MKRVCFLLTCVVTMVAHTGLAQKQVVTQNQIWFGYMTSTRLSTRYAWWNDTHLVPSGFFVLRTGLTRNWENASLTAGYAFLLLPKSPQDLSLERKEHRPWAQLQGTFPLANGFSLTQRIRYDARFRQRVVGDEFLDEYSFVNRVRFMISIRKFIRVSDGSKWRPFVSLNNEILVNFGKEVTFNSFDQNRISLMLGVQRANLQWQVGYMSRFVQVLPQQFINNNTLVVWVTHRFGDHVKAKHDDGVTE